MFGPIKWLRPALAACALGSGSAFPDATTAPAASPSQRFSSRIGDAGPAAAAPRSKPAVAPQLRVSTHLSPTELRRRPGAARPAEPVVAALPDPNRASGLAPVAPPPQAWLGSSALPVPDRWRLLEGLGILHQRAIDPYHQNVLKGDRPIWGPGPRGDEFLDLSAVSDSTYEYRRIPTAVGPQATTNAGDNGIFGRERQSAWTENLILSAVYFKGDTTFKPPDYALHLSTVFNVNYATAEEARTLDTDPRAGRYRYDQWIGLQELFGELHLRDVSDRFDFDSVRLGIQPFSSDFRGFLFQDNQPALRLFGTRDNNRWQYNVAWIRRLEKNTNSGLNDVTRTPRNDDVYLFNLYRQDFPVPGFTSQGIVVHNRNREDGRAFYDDNGFLQRPEALGDEQPRRYEVTYLGYNGDGHFGRLNLTASSYWVVGTQSHGVFSPETRRISAGFAAAEASIDVDWLRLRASALWASGDRNPHNATATGFDAIFENPQFAGADTSFFIRQSIPLIGGGGIALTTRNGVLDDLRSSKDFGQSNFENPGTELAGLGADADVSPQLRVSANLNHLWFANTSTLELARNQGAISTSIGWDISTALTWRPWFNQNLVLRGSGAMLIPGEGFRQLFPDKTGYSVLADVILAY